METPPRTNIFEYSHSLDPKTLLELGPEKIFENTDAADWISVYRYPQFGKLDIEPMANFLGLELRRARLISAGRLDDRNYPAQPATITINRHSNHESHRVTFGHEIGHMFLQYRLGFPHVEPHGDEKLFHAVEDFCEIFGQELVLPRTELSTIEKIDEKLLENLAQAYETDLQTTIVQLMRAQRLPLKVFIDTKLPEDLDSANKGRPVRNAVCLDCQTNFGFGKCSEASEETSIFNFLHKTYGTKFSVCSSFRGVHWLDR